MLSRHRDWVQQRGHLHEQNLIICLTYSSESEKSSWQHLTLKPFQPPSESGLVKHVTYLEATAAKFSVALATALPASSRWIKCSGSSAPSHSRTKRHKWQEMGATTCSTARVLINPWSNKEDMVKVWALFLRAQFVKVLLLCSGWPNEVLIIHCPLQRVCAWPQCFIATVDTWTGQHQLMNMTRIKESLFYPCHIHYCRKYIFLLWTIFLCCLFKTDNYKCREDWIWQNTWKCPEKKWAFQMFFVLRPRGTFYII